MAINNRNLALAWYRQDQWQLLLDYPTNSDKLEHAEEKVKAL